MRSLKTGVCMRRDESRERTQLTRLALHLCEI